MIFKKVVSLIFWVCMVFVGKSQHAPADTAAVNGHAQKGSHRLAFGLGHTSVSEGQVDGETQWLPLASWSLNYDYWLSDKWAIGLQNDWILETFLVEHNNEEIIERKNPIAVVPVGMYKFGKRWTGLLGAGVEFSKGHNLGLTRLGIEYGWHLPGNREAGVAVVWDNKWNYYNSWGIAFTFARLWPQKH
jgi:hypothetical protein